MPNSRGEGNGALEGPPACGLENGTTPAVFRAFDTSAVERLGRRTKQPWPVAPAPLAPRRGGCLAVPVQEGTSRVESAIPSNSAWPRHREHEKAELPLTRRPVTLQLTVVVVGMVLEGGPEADQADVCPTQLTILHGPGSETKNSGAGDTGKKGSGGRRSCSRTAADTWRR